jgi:hypothetical protein
MFFPSSISKFDCRPEFFHISFHFFELFWLGLMIEVLQRGGSTVNQAFTSPLQDMDLVLEEEFLELMVHLFRSLPMGDIWQMQTQQHASDYGDQEADILRNLQVPFLTERGGGDPSFGQNSSIYYIYIYIFYYYFCLFVYLFIYLLLLFISFSFLLSLFTS